MIKRILLTLVALSLLTAPAFAAVSGSAHDIGGSKQCEACHVPHNASQTDKLWAGTAGTGYTDVGNLCWTCHNASGIANTVSVDVMNTSLRNHLHGGASSITDCSGVDACHDVHTQNPNATGKFLQVAAQNGSYCQTCHDGTAPNAVGADFSAADAQGDHTSAATNHELTAVNCEDCHDVHGAAVQTTSTEDTKILRADNTNGYWGGVCVACHETGVLTGASAVSSDVWGFYTQATNDGSELTHPTTATAEGAHPGFQADGCNVCHDVHGANFADKLLPENNANSQSCVVCHSSGGNGPDVGTSTHPTPDMSAQNTRNQGGTNAMPWAQQIDEDGVGGADWAAATTDLMVCETCHSVHGRGVGTESDHFLRNANDDNQICTVCHAN